MDDLVLVRSNLSRNGISDVPRSEKADKSCLTSQNAWNSNWQFLAANAVLPYRSRNLQKDGARLAA